MEVVRFSVVRNACYVIVCIAAMFSDEIHKVLDACITDENVYSFDAIIAIHAIVGLCVAFMTHLICNQQVCFMQIRNFCTFFCSFIQCSFLCAFNIEKNEHKRFCVFVRTILLNKTSMIVFNSRIAYITPFITANMRNSVFALGVYETKAIGANT